MTGPTGRVFISYRRASASDVAKLVSALHEHGIPTWQDVANLEETPTEDRLRHVIRSDDTAGAVLWITPDVADSAIIRRVEVPELLARAKADPSFYVIPILSGGVNYSDLEALFAGVAAADELHRWNVHRIGVLTAGEIAQVAARVLGRRLAACHAGLDADQPIRIAFYTRAAPPRPSGAELVIDWSARLTPRPASPAAWSDHLLPALSALADAIRRTAPGRAAVASGLSSVPAAVALGSSFLTVTGPELAWDQVTDGSHVRWALTGHRQPTGFDLNATAEDVAATDLGIVISVTADARPALAASRASLPSFRAIIDARPPAPGPRPDVLLNPTDGESLARAVIAEARQAKATFGAVGAVHLFVVGPLGLAVMLGRLLNTFGEVRTYEFLPDMPTNPYQLGVTLRATR